MGMFKWIGNIVNDITGVSSQSARQEQLANSAHQREVADLKEAGLNPVLSAGGQGSPQPQTGSSAGNPMADILSMITTAKEVERTNAEIKGIETNNRNQTARTQAEINKMLAEAGYKKAEIEYYNKYGVFPGATESDTYSGLGFSRTKTRPVGKENTARKVKTDKEIQDEINRDLKFWKK